MQDTLVISDDRQPIRSTSVAQHLCCTFATDMPSKCMISYIHEKVWFFHVISYIHQIIYFGWFNDDINITLEYLGKISSTHKNLDFVTNIMWSGKLEYDLISWREYYLSRDVVRKNLHFPPNISLMSTMPS